MINDLVAQGFDDLVDVKVIVFVAGETARAAQVVLVIMENRPGR